MGGGGPALRIDREAARVGYPSRADGPTRLIGLTFHPSIGVHMNWALGTATFFIIWWTLLFAILPFGVRSQHEAESMVPGTDPGAPVRPRLLLKLGVNTVLAAILWAIANWAYIRYYVES